MLGKRFSEKVIGHMTISQNVFFPFLIWLKTPLFLIAVQLLKKKKVRIFTKYYTSLQ